jgi:uncharacterized protein
MDRNFWMVEEVKPGGRCPICKKPTAQGSRPFCSKRCRDVDLSQWLGGGYVIAGGDADADEDGDDGIGMARPASSKTSNTDED